MKRLMLVRHAKSGWDQPALSDFERPLNKRGEHDADEMAKRVVEKGLVPEYILSSPALRAKTTATYFAKEFGLGEAEYIDAIYEASTSTLLSIVNKISDDYTFAAIFGHNPGMSDLLQYFTDTLDEMPTCAVALIRFNSASWQLISRDTGTVEYYDYPKS